jgi:hypothetical protein
MKTPHNLAGITVLAGTLAVATAGCHGGKTTSEPAHKPAATSAGESTPAGFKPQFDGLYGSATHDDERTYVRFFPNGTAFEVGTSSDATPDHVRRWLRPGDPHAASNGPWKYSPQGSFTSKSARGTVDFTVLNFRGDSFDLHSVSHINGHVGTEHLIFSAD